MIQEVGFDILPNSYIRSIEISKISPFQNKVEVLVVLKDIKKDGLFSWYNRDELGKYLNLLVVASTSEELNSLLDSGDLPLDKTKILKQPLYNKKDVRCKQVKVGWNLSNKVNSFDTVDGELFEFEYRKSFFIKSSKQNLKLYCCTYIDTSEYAKDYRIDLADANISSYTGPVASEEVFREGEVVSTAYSFRSTQGSIWSGPVRFIDGEYYSGSKGEIGSFNKLIRSETENMKIKDFRKFKAITNKPHKSHNKLCIFSEPLYSYDSNGSLSALFSIDFKSIILSRSRMAKHLSTVNKELLDNLVQRVKLSKIIIIKTKKGSKNRFEPIVNTSDLGPYNLNVYESKRAKFEEIVMSTDPGIRSFSLKDYEDYRTKGKYQYSVFLEFQDPVASYMDSIASQVQINLSKLKNYVDLTTIPKYQNKTRTKLTDQFATLQLSRFGTEQQPWNVAVQLFSTYCGLLRELSPQQLKQIASSNISKIHPIFASAKSAKHFLTEYSELHQVFIKKFNPKIKNISNVASRGIKGGSSTNRNISIRKTFGEIIEHRGKDSNVSYCKFEKSIFPTILADEFVSRSQKEKEKFYTSSPSLNGTNISKMSKNAANKLSKDANNVIGFLTPVSFKARKEMVSLSNPSSVDIDKFNDLVHKANIGQESVKKQKIIKSNKLSIRVAKKLDNYIEKVDKKYKKTEDNLGKSSKFKSSEVKFRPTIKSKLLKNVKRKLKQKNNKKLTTKQFKADSQKMKEFINKADKIRLPPSLISVIASESSSAKNNVLKSEVDLISNPETRDFFSLNYTNPVKVMTIKRYKKDKTGKIMLNKPVWGIISEDDLDSDLPLVCKLSSYKAKFFETQGLVPNIANENFIVLPLNPISKNLTESNSFSIKQVSNIINSISNKETDYHTTNPIVQTENKNGPLR